MDLSSLVPVVDGKPYTAGERLTIVEPASGQAIGALPDLGANGVDAAVQAARRASPGWAAATPRDRATALLAIADVLERRIDEFAELEARDVGKPLADARGEIGSAADK